MALIKVSYKGMRAVLPSMDDLSQAKQNLAGLDSYMRELVSLGLGKDEHYSVMMLEHEYAKKYVSEIANAISANGGARI